MAEDRRKRYWNYKGGITEEGHFLDRRRFLRELLAAGGALAAPGAAGPGGVLAAPPGGGEDPLPPLPAHALSEEIYPVGRNAKYAVKASMTERDAVFRYNNFYEFSLKKDVYKYVEPFEPFPWHIEVRGHCRKRGKFSIDDILRKCSLEERVYRFRCVEAWAMVVPWTGFPLSDFLKSFEPNSRAKYVRFLSFKKPSQARGQKLYTHYDWPYYEGIRIDEAMNPLAFLATGIYGKQLPKQCGAPIRVVLPWKYGYKGPKSIARIEFTDQQPRTFWNDAHSEEYGFYSNVNPGEPHPRWSQATERMLGTGEKQPTRLYNGYAEEVDGLYTGEEF